MLDLTMGYLVAQEYMDSWILAAAKFMFLSLESEALDPEDLGARWSSIGNQGLKSFSSGSFQPALAVFLLSLPVFFPNWLLSNHSLSSSAVIVLCKNLGCQSIYAGVMMCLGHLLMLGSQCCSETGHGAWFGSFRDRGSPHWKQNPCWFIGTYGNWQIFCSCYIATAVWVQAFEYCRCADVRPPHMPFLQLSNGIS